MNRELPFWESTFEYLHQIVHIAILAYSLAGHLLAPPPNVNNDPRVMPDVLAPPNGTNVNDDLHLDTTVMPTWFDVWKCYCNVCKCHQRKSPTIWRFFMIQRRYLYTIKFFPPYLDPMVCSITFLRHQLNQHILFFNMQKRNNRDQDLLDVLLMDLSYENIGRAIVPTHLHQ